jgi:hypothetical protein
VRGPSHTLIVDAPHFVTTRRSRSKNGVASLAYDPVVHAEAGRSKQCGGSERAIVSHGFRLKCGNDEIESPSRDALRARVLLTTAEDNQAKTGFDRRLMKAAGGGGFHPIASGT